LSNEHTESNHTQQNNGPNPGRRRNRRRRPRTLRWYHESNVGVDDLKPNVVVKYFISIAEDETPSIRLVLMNRDTVVKEDGSFSMKPQYAGDIERNAIPIEILDLEAFWNTLVSMKARVMRMQDEFHGRTRDYETGRFVKPPEPKRSQQPARPLTHRLEIPAAVVAKAVAVPPEQKPCEKSVPAPRSLADALPGW
jgi:hypothetical protein